MSKFEKIFLIKGDITQSEVEAIVNAANTELWLGSGVAGAIAKAGGPEIQKACDKNGPVSLGEVAVTPAGNLKAKYIFHAASMDLDGPTTEESLYDAVKNSLLTAEELGIKSLAIPAIGTGVGGLDEESCAEITLLELTSRAPQISSLEKVEVYLFDSETYEIFEKELKRLSSNI